MLFTLDAVLLAIAGIATVPLVRRFNAARRVATAEAAAKLAGAGLKTTGNPLGSFTAHPVEGAGMAVANRTRPVRPGATEPGDEACVVSIDLPLVDQIVCSAADVDKVMGPLPAVPRVRTGHERFDTAYAVFIGVNGAAPPASSYRMAPVAGDVPWAQPALLDRLLELDLLWMRVRDGQAQLAFPPLEAEDVGRATALARAFEQAARGLPLPPLVRGPRIVQPRHFPGEIVVKSWLVSILAGPIASVLLTCILASAGVDADLACEGGEVVWWQTVGGDGGRVMGCAPHTHEPHFWLYDLACVLLVIGLISCWGVVAEVLRGMVRNRSVDAGPPGEGPYR